MALGRDRAKVLQRLGYGHFDNECALLRGAANGRVVWWGVMVEPCGSVRVTTRDY